VGKAGFGVLHATQLIRHAAHLLYYSWLIISTFNSWLSVFSDSVIYDLDYLLVEMTFIVVLHSETLPLIAYGKNAFKQTVLLHNYCLFISSLAPTE